MVDFYHGDPAADLVELVHRHDALAGWQIGSLDDAVAAVSAGCDLLVVRGVEGGGRMHGTESLWPLLLEIVESVDVPVLAASAAESVLTDEFRAGWPDEWSWSRVLRSSLEAARMFPEDVVGELSMGPMTMPVPRLGVPPPLIGSSGAVEAMPMYAGESVRFVRAVEPAAEIVRTIAEGAEKLLRVQR